MNSYATHTQSPNTDLESWNQSILSFDLSGLDAPSSDPQSLDERIELSLAALFDESAPVGVDPCTEFHCTSYW